MWRQWLGSSRRFWPYVALTAVIMLPLLRPGFIFAPDMSFGPQIPMPDGVTPAYLFFVLLHGMNLILPAMVVQKLLLIAVVLLPGIGMHRLLETLRRPGLAAAEWRWACYFGGLLYLCNPFVYSRFMMGQYAVLLGYGILPFLLRALWRFLERPGLRQAWPVVALAVVSSIVSVHSIGPALIAAAALYGLWIYRRKNDRAWLRRLGVWTSVVAGTVLTASSYWLVPLALGHGRTAAIVSGFSAADQSAFAVQGEGFGIVGNVFSLRGFWADADSSSLYAIPADQFFWWWLPLVALMLLAACGMIVGWRLQKSLTSAFLAISLAGAVLALSTALPGLRDIFSALSRHIPLLGGYREPQKFVMLLALSYAYFGGVAVAALRSIARQGTILKRHVQLLTCTLLLLPVLSAPLTLWGFGNQFTPREYPSGWYSVNEYLNQHAAAHDKVLFLPWHLYMEFKFAGSIIAVPAGKFFNRPVVVSDDPEYRDAVSYNRSPDQRAVSALLPPHAPPARAELAAQLHALGIQYVLVAKEFDYAAYAAVTQRLDPVLNTVSLTLYKVPN